MKFNWLRKLFGIKRNEAEIQCIHDRTLKDIEETTKKIQHMNKVLVQRSTAYKIYIATGGAEKV